MIEDKPDTTKLFEELLANPPPEGQHYMLRLYVTGMTPRSLEALASIKTICEERLQGRYELEVIDIYMHPEQAKTPRSSPPPPSSKAFPYPCAG